MTDQQPHSTAGTIHIFDFEPGDGRRYRVLFGRLPPIQQLFGGYTVFGLGEADGPLITIILTNDSMSRTTFTWHWRQVEFVQPWDDPTLIEATAYTVLCALMGVADMPAAPGHWIADWRRHLPAAAMG